MSDLSYITQPITSVPWDEIEPGIVARLHILVDAGFSPFASCEGHGDWNLSHTWIPWIRVSDTDVEGIHEALKAAGEYGYSIDVHHSFPGDSPSDDCERYTHIEWWHEGWRKRWQSLNELTFRILVLAEERKGPLLLGQVNTSMIDLVPKELQDRGHVVDEPRATVAGPYLLYAVSEPSDPQPHTPLILGLSLLGFQGIDGPVDHVVHGPHDMRDVLSQLSVVEVPRVIYLIEIAH